MSMQMRENRDPFPSTSWTEVAHLVHANGDERRDALQAMLPRYLPALRTHLLYTRRLPVDLCEDVIQAFVAEKILSRNLIGEARRERGKFRAFLITTIDHFMLNFLRSERSRSRREQGCDDFEALGTGETPVPSVAFDVEWARELLKETLTYMQQECNAKDRAYIWQIFHARTLAPILENKQPVPYQDLVKELGFLSPSQAANALVTANRMFIRILRGIIAMYAATEQEVEEEIRQLHEILASAGAGIARPGV